MEPITVVILGIGSVCSALMALIALLSLVFKKPKQWIKKWIKDLTRDELNEQLDKLYKQVNDLREQINALIDQEKTKLGHAIMTIYDRSVARGYITIADKKDLIELHQAYKACNGNHHVDEYFDLLMDMDVR
jgi:predicted PurR-regulated permease PerM